MKFDRAWEVGYSSGHTFFNKGRSMSRIKSLLLRNMAMCLGLSFLWAPFLYAVDTRCASLFASTNLIDTRSVESLIEILKTSGPHRLMYHGGTSKILMIQGIKPDKSVKNPEYRPTMEAMKIPSQRPDMLNVADVESGPFRSQMKKHRRFELLNSVLLILPNIWSVSSVTLAAFEIDNPLYPNSFHPVLWPLEWFVGFQALDYMVSQVPVKEWIKEASAVNNGRLLSLANEQNANAVGKALEVAFAKSDFVLLTVREFDLSSQNLGLITKDFADILPQDVDVMKLKRLEWFPANLKLKMEDPSRYMLFDHYINAEKSLGFAKLRPNTSEMDGIRMVIRPDLSLKQISLHVSRLPMGIYRLYSTIDENYVLAYVLIDPLSETPLWVYKPSNSIASSEQIYEAVTGFLVREN